MKTLVTLFILLKITLLGYNYDKFLLNVQSTIYPKLLLLNESFVDGDPKEEFIFYIVHHTSDAIKSENIKVYIDKKFQYKLGNRKLKIVVKEFSTVNATDRAHAFYILHGYNHQIKKVCEIAKKQHAITFTYDKIYFSSDVLLSVTIENDHTIHLNKRVLREYGIPFIEAFYHTVKMSNE